MRINSFNKISKRETQNSQTDLRKSRKDHSPDFDRAEEDIEMESPYENKDDTTK